MQKILVLEDEADIRELIAITLSGPQLQCVLCSHVADAISELKKNKPDFVLTDLKLPDGTGLDLLKESRALYPDVAVAIMTAFADTDSAINALKLGAVDYLKKPIDTSTLRALVKQQLDLKSPRPATTHVARESRTTQDIDKNPIVAALEEHRWNKRAAAEALGMSYRQLRYRISKLGLD